MTEFVPVTYKCRAHGNELTPTVKAKVLAEPTKISSSGFKVGLGRAPRSFRVVVECPEDGGHELVFVGTYRT